MAIDMNKAQLNGVTKPRDRNHYDQAQQERKVVVRHEVGGKNVGDWSMEGRHDVFLGRRLPDAGAR